MAEGNALITGLFAQHESLERAFMSIAARGYGAGDVRLLMSAESRDRFLAAAMRRRGNGGALGALVTALVGARIPDERRAAYERGVSEGGIVLGVTLSSMQDAESVERDWRAAGGEDIVCPVLRAKKDAA
jgi:hypothetical protein